MLVATTTILCDLTIELVSGYHNDYHNLIPEPASHIYIYKINYKKK